jgi:hypothetical protein
MGPGKKTWCTGNIGLFDRFLSVQLMLLATRGTFMLTKPVLIATLGLASLGVTSATAATCNTGPLKDCFVSADGLEETEAIAKIDFNTDGSFKFTGNPDFSSVTGEEFDLSGIVRDGDNEVLGGTVTYTLGALDPGMTAFSTKRGQLEELFYGSDWISYVDGVFTFNLGNEGQAVSNFVIYDNFVAPIPLPAAGWLLLAGLGLLGLRKRPGRKAFA